MKDRLIARKTATEVIKNFEGCRLKSYVLKLADGRYENWATIGWGKAIPLSEHPKTITQAEADALLESTVNAKEAALRKEIPAAVLDALTDGEYAGVLSFRYNVKDSSWLSAQCNTRKALVAGDIAKFKRMHLTWNKGSGVVLAGLKRRRRVENEIMVKGCEHLAVIRKAKWYA